MTQVHVLSLVDDDDTLVGVYSTSELVKRALINFVAGSPVDPTGSETFLGEVCPEDWAYEPTAFELATHVLSEAGYRWMINEYAVDEEL